jgi:hypothetical protein
MVRSLRPPPNNPRIFLLSQVPFSFHLLAECHLPKAVSFQYELVSSFVRVLVSLQLTTEPVFQIPVMSEFLTNQLTYYLPTY